jgi:protein-S-isoprenylcysteine O-methyltransferase Ste14
MAGFDRVFVWTGGAVFVASLAYCWYAFAVTWAGGPSPGEGASWHAVAINLLLVAAFAAHHSLFARAWVKETLSGLLPERLIRPLYVWIASLLFIALVALWRPVGGELYHASGWAAVILLAAQIVGVILIASAVGVIDPLELAGIRQHKPGGALQIVGPYRIVRHPLYLGWILLVFGAAHMTGDRLAFAAFTSFYLVVAVPWEERSLRSAFGAEYDRYSRRVRWRVLPYIY